MGVAGVGIVAACPEHLIEPKVLAIRIDGVIAERPLPTRIDVDPVVPIHGAGQVDAASDLVVGGEPIGCGDGRSLDVREESAGEVEAALHVQDRHRRALVGTVERGRVDQVLRCEHRKLPGLKGRRGHYCHEVLGVRPRGRGGRGREVVERVYKARCRGGGERLRRVVAVVGEDLQAHLVELREHQLQPPFYPRVGLGSRRLLELNLDVVGVVHDQHGRADQLQGVVCAHVHAPQREHHGETVHRRHVGAPHRPGDEAADSMPGQVAAFEPVDPSQRVGGAVVAVGERCGDFAAAGPKGIVQVIACVFVDAVSPLVELVGVRIEGSGADAWDVGRPVDVLVKAVVIANEMPERSDQPARLLIP